MKPIDDNHITVKGWMVSKMNLKGNKLLAYALIYGFSQDGQSTFKGSIAYVTRWLNCARSTAIETLDQLEADGWIAKSKNSKSGIERNEYKAANVDENGVVRFSDGSSPDSGRVPVGKSDGGSPDSGHKIPISNSLGSIEGEESAPAQFIAQTIALETIPTVECEVPRPAARPTSKISELQKNINAHSEAAEHFLRLLQAKGHSLNGAEKYAAAYFLNEQRKGRWVSLLIPVGAGAEHQWLGEHGPGIIQWAQRQPQFERNNGTQPTAPTIATNMRLSNPENAPR